MKWFSTIQMQNNIKSVVYCKLRLIRSITNHNWSLCSANFLIYPVSGSLDCLHLLGFVEIHCSSRVSTSFLVPPPPRLPKYTQVNHVRVWFTEKSSGYTSVAKKTVWLSNRERLLLDFVPSWEPSKSWSHGGNAVHQVPGVCVQLSLLGMFAFTLLVSFEGFFVVFLLVKNRFKWKSKRSARGLCFNLFRFSLGGLFCIFFFLQQLLNLW